VTVALPLVVVCLLLQAFFSGAEMALVTASRAGLQARAEAGHRGAATALDLLATEERMLATTLIGTNLSSISATTLATGLLLSAGINSEVVIALLFVPAVLVLGEALPKTLAATHSDTVAPLVARPIQVAGVLLRPILFLMSAWAGLLRRSLGSQDARIGREDLVGLIEDTPLRDIMPAERRIIQRVLEMPGTTVADCMTALVEVAAVPDTATVSEAAEAVLRTGHSRLPVYRDRVDHVVGVVHHRALLRPPDDALVTSVMVPPTFVPETKRVDELMRAMLHAQDRFAVVVDEFGGTIGVVTLEDVVEEIVGSIQDERDSEPQIRKLGEREWRVPGNVRIEEIETATGVDLPEGDYSTVAGLVLARTGRIPAAGEVVRLGPLQLTVEAATDRAVVSVRVTRSG
jgi:CBS domain containing-hemolysin-like protein